MFHTFYPKKRKSRPQNISSQKIHIRQKARKVYYLRLFIFYTYLL